jgi:hypothetical protein
MLNKVFAIAALFLVLVAVSCKKDDDNNNNNTTACNGKNLCMKIDTMQVSENATWRVLTSGRRRISWETATGLPYKNIEIDIYDTVATSGTYTFATSPGAGQAGFQYYEQSPLKNIQGTTGTLTLTSTANNQLSGTFSLTAKDQNNVVVTITEGNFVNVPKQ